MTEMQIHFVLKGEDFDPSHVTQRLGMKPDFTRRKGVSDGTGEASLYTEWGINSAVNVVSYEELFEPFISDMGRHRELLLKVSEECSARWELEIEVKIPYGDSFPELILPRKVIRFASDICADLGFNIVFDYGR